MRLETWSHRACVLILFGLLCGGVALAQDSDIGERNIGPSAPAPKPAASPATGYEIPAVAIPPSRGASSAAAQGSPAAATGAQNPAAPSKPHKYFPYTIRPGDTLGSISAYFGVPVAQLAKLNRLHEDDDLIAGEALKIPNPFEASQKNLEAQVDQLTTQLRDTQQKLQQAESQVLNLTSKNSEVSTENASLTEATRVLPWWRGTALATAAAALLMLGVTGLTLFEWWMIRRRFLAISDLAQSLSRLDVKYKEMLAKAELRMQQLYGRRRPAGSAETVQHGVKTADEIEVERLSHELREVLERNLQRLGIQRAGKHRSRLAAMLGAEEEPTVEPGHYRR
jgi:LysM repeat protein